MAMTLNSVRTSQMRGMMTILRESIDTYSCYLRILTLEYKEEKMLTTLQLIVSITSLLPLQTSHSSSPITINPESGLNSSTAVRINVERP